MRFLIEIAIVAALLAFAWETPFAERFGKVVPAVAKQMPKAKPAVAPPTPLSIAGLRATPPPPTPTPGAWMWDPNRKATLDKPVRDGR